MWDKPAIQLLAGDRLHLQHGPIDVVLRAQGEPEALQAAYRAAAKRFETILPELVGELSELRRPIADAPNADTPVAKRMIAACAPFAGIFITPMAAVAGSVADELLATMLAAAPLEKAFVNDGGDIAVHIAEGESLTIGIAGDFSGGEIPAMNGSVTLRAVDGVGGIATSGWQGRSFSLGIADSVTVLAQNAASADAAATLIANAVNVEAPGITRRPARELDPDSDLGDLLITQMVERLTLDQRAEALAKGLARAAELRQRGLIIDAALTCGAITETLGGLLPATRIKNLEHAS